MLKEKLPSDVKIPSHSWFYKRVGQLFPHVKTHCPSTDKCNTCSVLSLQGKKEEQKAQQDKAHRFREQLKNDMTLENCITFHLEQVQPLPFIRENKAFYNRKTWLYNLGIHETKTNKAFMYIWTETIASQGSREIASCLYSSLSNNLQEPVDTLIAWSDTCGGQNRNFIIASFWLRVLAKFDINSVIHRFPISGHSFLPNDRDFADVEKAKKKKDSIYTVDQYKDVMELSKKKNQQSRKWKVKIFLISASR